MTAPEVEPMTPVDLFVERRAELADDQARAAFDRILVTRLLPLVGFRTATAAIGSALCQVEREHGLPPVQWPHAVNDAVAGSVWPEPVVDPLYRRRGLIDLVLAPVRRWLP